MQDTGETIMSWKAVCKNDRYNKIVGGYPPSVAVYRKTTWKISVKENSMHA